jgi:LysR family nitrogen assimilation transcriptional regulator
VAHTALGLQVRNLEQELETDLFTRHSRGMTVTDAGRVLYEHALEILAVAEEARREVRAAAKTTTAAITLGITPSIANLVGTELIVAARERLPGPPLKVVEELSFVLIDALRRGEMDIALAYEVPAHRGILRTPLMEEPLLFVAAPALIGGEGPIAFKDLAGTELALTSSRDMVWRLVHEAGERLAIPVNVAFEVQSLQAIKTLIQRGVATSIMPFGAVAADLADGTIAARPIVRPELSRTLFLARAEDRTPFPDEDDVLRFLDGVLRRLGEAIGPGARVIQPLVEPPETEAP